MSSVHLAHDVRLFQAEARSLSRAGFDVTVIALDDTTQSETDGVRIISLPVPGNRLHRVLQTLRILLQALGQDADLFVIHDPELLPAAVLLRLLTRRPVLYDVHEDVPAAILGRSWIPRSARAAVARFFRLVERLSLPFIAGVTLADHAYIKYYDRARSEVVLNYPLMTYADLYEPAAAEVGGAPILVYVGSITELRGLFEMLRLVQRLRETIPDVRLRLVGPMGSEGERLRADELVRQLGLETNVEFTGLVSHMEVHRHILDAHVGLALLHPDPNYLGSLPTKMFEYMMMGRPVVVSDFPLWKQIVDESRCGYAVDPLDEEAIARAVEKVIGDDAERIRMGEEGRRAVMERYGWDGEAEKLIAFYRRVLKRA